MRDIFFLVFFVAFIPMMLSRAYVGAYVWTWFTLMQPHRLIFGFAHGLRFNDIIATLCLIALLKSRESKRLPKGALTAFILAFFLHASLSLVVAHDFAFSWNFYYAFIVPTIGLLGILFLTLTTRARVIGIVWVVTLSLGWYAISKGLGAIKYGGNLAEEGLGPPATLISDRNHFSLALVMVAPLAAFLFRYTNNPTLRLLLGFIVIGAALTVVAAGSRGGFIAMLAMFLYFWAKSKVKLKSAFLIGLVALTGNFLATDEYRARIRGAFEEAYIGEDRSRFSDERARDESFQGRLSTWWKAWQMALDRPVFGFGPRAVQHPDIPRLFINHDDPLLKRAPQFYFTARAAHSIYFETVGSLGFVGLGLFLAVAASAWLTVSGIRLQTRQRPELFWARDLANAIQVSLLAYLVGGALLSLAFFDGFWILMVILVSLNQIVRESLGATAPRWDVRRAGRFSGHPAFALTRLARIIPGLREPERLGFPLPREAGSTRGARESLKR